MNHTGIDREDSLSPIDEYFATTMLNLAGETSPTVARLLQLACAAARHGDVCIDLKDAGTRSLLASPGITLPVLADMMPALLKSPLIGDGNATTPLVMDSSGRIYLHRFWHTQNRLLKGIIAKSTLTDTHSLPDDPVSRAIEVAHHSNFLVITGGPGAGKTTLVATVIASLLTQKPELRIAACAPTGKAAVRLRASLDNSRVSPMLTDRFSATVLSRLPRQVSTIHKLLSPVMHTGKFRYSEDRTLPIDVLVVDEASMVDLHLMAALFSAVPSDAKIILLGDQSQLASIEPGRVLGDICFAARHERPVQNNPVAQSVVTLAGSHRFSQHSDIGQLATAVNTGASDTALRLLLQPESDELEFVDVEHPDATTKMTSLINTLYLNAAKATDAAQKLRQFDSVRILSAVNNGPFGVHALNRMAEAQLEAMGVIRVTGEWYDSKPIMIPQNDYSVSLFNGDTGVIVSDGGRLWACFGGDDSQIRRLSVSAMRHPLPAYATTIHKSQGSEFDHVVLVIPNISPVLSRELLYTAVTRAKRKLTIFSSPDVIRHCVTQPTRRAFSLGYHLWGVEENASPTHHTVT
ncbi:MAG: exodeoxyribonuclease V subunit alpha [Deltaproteobacteria bacterium]|nr:exodeoxyribonuclease V subunit alpha [Deltaproteobacteria bacterium]